MSDIGLTRKEMYGDTFLESSSDEDKILYPSFDLKDKQIKEAGLGDCEIGEFYTAEIKFRVTSKSINEGQDGEKKRITLEIQDIDGADEAKSKSDEKTKEDDEESTGSDYLDSIGIKQNKNRRPKSPKEVGI